MNRFNLGFCSNINIDQRTHIQHCGKWRLKHAGVTHENEFNRFSLINEHVKLVHIK